MGALRVLSLAAVWWLGYLLLTGPVAAWYAAQTCDSRIVLALVVITTVAASQEDQRPR